MNGKKFKNVHWIVSVEATGNYYNYIRYGGDWEEFCKNLNVIRSIREHRISFNMLYCVLNHLEIFKCIDFLTGLGFHNNSFVLGPVYTPEYLNILNLPMCEIDQIKTELKRRIGTRPGFILEDGYINLLRYLDTPFMKNLDQSFKQLNTLDQRRKLDSRSIFKDLYDTNC